MYSRGPREREAVNVPENYSGNAFRNNIYTDIVPETPREPEPQIKEEPAAILPTIIETVAEERPHKDHSPRSVFSSLLPNFSSSSKFPFGHGIGAEELFILGIMLLIYTAGDSDQPMDSELLLLLCILLFSG